MFEWIFKSIYWEGKQWKCTTAGLSEEPACWSKVIPKAYTWSFFGSRAEEVVHAWPNCIKTWTPALNVALQRISTLSLLRKSSRNSQDIIGRQSNTNLFRQSQQRRASCRPHTTGKLLSEIVNSFFLGTNWMGRQSDFLVTLIILSQLWHHLLLQKQCKGQVQV